MGSGAQTRTGTKTVVNSHPLCRLSYAGSELPPNLAAKIAVRESGCWEWVAGRTGKGYGAACIPGTGKSALAHRLVYSLLVGEIPDGWYVTHLCGVRVCVNPTHLEPIHPAERARSDARAATCKRGHETDYAEARDASGMCRVCKNEARRRSA